MFKGYKNQMLKKAIYLKTNKIFQDGEVFQKWVNIANGLGIDYYVINDNDNFFKIFDKTSNFAPKEIMKSDRTTYYTEVLYALAPKWWNAAFAHLTTFQHAQNNDIDCFWNIDADDVVFMHPTDKCVEMLETIQDYADKNEGDAYSLDMWRSRNAGLHWSFGVSYIKNNVDWIKLLKENHNKKSLIKGDNIDWLFTCFKENNLAKLETFCFNNAYLYHFEDGFLNWQNDLLFLRQKGIIEQKEERYTIKIADDVIKFEK